MASDDNAAPQPTTDSAPPARAAHIASTTGVTLPATPVRTNILITGASSGLGAGMARQFADMGRNLALCARRTDRIDKLAAELRAANPEITVVTRRLDVNDHAEVFAVFKEFRAELGRIDRVVVNAGVGAADKPIGRGGFAENARTVETNVLGALAQVEAAMDIFQDQNSGHLAVVSSFNALRALGGNVAAYAASKSFVAALAAGIRADAMGTPIEVTTLFPGYIRSDMLEGMPPGPLVASAERGARALVAAIERERARSYVPAWPWIALVPVMKYSPMWLLRKLT